MDQLISCLEQKVILLTKILNLTKQIEVRASQPEIELDDFLDQRGFYIKRVNKCDDLIANLLKEKTETQQDRLNKILQFKITKEDCSENELRVLNLAKDCTNLINRAAVLDKTAHDRIKKQCNELRDKINQMRQKDNNKQLYQNIE